MGRLTGIDLRVPRPKLGHGDAVSRGDVVALVARRNQVPTVTGTGGARHERRRCGDGDANANVVVEPEVGAACHVCQSGYERTCFSHEDRCMEEGSTYQR